MNVRARVIERSFENYAQTVVNKVCGDGAYHSADKSAHAAYDRFVGT